MLYPIEPWAQRTIFYTLLFDLQEKTQIFNVRLYFTVFIIRIFVVFLAFMKNYVYVGLLNNKKQDKK